MKFRIGLIIKNLGLWPIYIFGGLFCAGLLAGGSYAVAEKGFIQEQFANAGAIVDDAQTTLKNASDDIQFSFDFASQAQGQVQGAVANLETLKQKLTEASNSTILDTVSQGGRDYKKDIQDIITKIDSVVQSLNGINIPGQDTVDAVQSVIGPNGSVMNVLSTINSWFANNTSEDSQIWVYYDTVATVLLSVGAALVGLFALGFILLVAFNKRVDGYWVPRKHLKKNLAIHIKKILRRNPDLAKYLMQKHGINIVR